MYTNGGFYFIPRLVVLLRCWQCRCEISAYGNTKKGVWLINRALRQMTNKMVVTANKRWLTANKMGVTANKRRQMANKPRIMANKPRVTANITLIRAKNLPIFSKKRPKMYPKQSNPMKTGETCEKAIIFCKQTETINSKRSNLYQTPQFPPNIYFQ